MSVLDGIVVGGITVLDLIAIVVIMLGAFITAQIVTIWLKKSLLDKMGKNELNLTLKVVTYLILLIGLFIASPHLKIDLSGLLVAGGVIGVIIGFASQSVVSNLVSGIFLIVERPVRIGDSIRIGEATGRVEEIKILSTIIRTFDGVYIRVPNEQVFTSNITNYVANVARRFEYEIGIGYRDDAPRAIRIIAELAEAHPFVLKDPAPEVFVDRLAESAIIIVVRLWAPSKDWYSVKTELLWSLKTALEDAGIGFPYPQRVVWFGDGRTPAGQGWEG